MPAIPSRTGCDEVANDECECESKASNPASYVCCIEWETMHSSARCFLYPSQTLAALVRDVLAPTKTLRELSSFAVPTQFHCAAATISLIRVHGTGSSDGRIAKGCITIVVGSACRPAGSESERPCHARRRDRLSDSCEQEDQGEVCLQICREEKRPGSGRPVQISRERRCFLPRGPRLWAPCS